jgi:ssDNA-binding Zn-finger/Zn-ribbon topoisomerase 1
MDKCEANKEDEINKRVKMLMKKFTAEQGYYVQGRCKICGKQGLVLLVATGQWILRCYHNPEHENISGWV